MELNALHLNNNKTTTLILEAKDGNRFKVNFEELSWAILCNLPLLITKDHHVCIRGDKKKLVSINSSQAIPILYAIQIP